MRSTKSLCPECFGIIDASIVEENGKMILEKTCAKHGYFKDIYWSDPVQFRRFEQYWHDGSGVLNPSGLDGNCPHSCGICTSHRTTTILANIDVTNKCNLHICSSTGSQKDHI